MKTLTVLLHIGAGHPGSAFGFIVFIGIILIIAAASGNKKGNATAKDDSENYYTDEEVDEILAEYKKGFAEGIRQAQENKQ